jgi:hypothetical protein
MAKYESMGIVYDNKSTFKAFLEFIITQQVFNELQAKYEEGKMSKDDYQFNINLTFNKKKE